MLFHLTHAAPAEGYGEALLPLEETKAWLRVLNNDQDDLIGALRDAAIDMVEQYGNLRMGPWTGLTAVYAGFGTGMRIGGGLGEPLAITGISYSSSAGTVVMPDGWRLDARQHIVPSSGLRWPNGASDVTVTFDAGYPEGACPKVLITAAKMFVAHLFINREAVVTGTITSEVPFGFATLVDRYRLPVI